MIRRFPAPFRYLWGATAISAVGSGLSVTALPLLTLSMVDDMGGAGSLGMIAVAATLPTFLFALPGGVLADATDRRRVMIAADVIRAAMLIVLVVLIVADQTNLAVVLVASFLLGAADVVFVGSAQPMVPMLVPPRQLDDANGALSAANDVGNEFVGRAAGSVAFSLAPALPFVIDAVTFVGSATLLRRLPPARAATSGPLRDRVQLRPGIDHLRRSRPLAVLWLALGVLSACNAVAFTLTVLIVRDRLDLPEAWFGPALAVVAAGAVVGGLVAGRVVRRLAPKRALLAAVLLNAVAYLVLGATTIRALAAVAWFTWGLGVTLGVVVAMSIRQRLIPDELRGRVLAMFRLVIAGGAVVGSAVAGLAGEAAGVGEAVIGAGVVQLAVLVLLGVGVPGRAVDEPSRDAEVIGTP